MRIAFAIFLAALVSSSSAYALCTTNSNYVAPHTRGLWGNGSLAYDTSTNTLKACDGTNWSALGSISTGGTANYVAKFSDAATLGISQIFDNGASVGIGTASPGATLDVNGSIHTGSATTGASCSGTAEGAFAYDTSTHAPVYCGSGGKWVSILGNCTAQSVSWSSCGGNATALANGGSASVTNTTASYSGSVTVTCTNGALTQSGATCNYDPCGVASPSPGTVCLDGTIYAGLSPDGNVKMYTTACDVGMSGTKNSCTGTRLKFYWGTYGITTGYTSLTTGKSNTANLIANYGTYSDGYTTGVPAAQACASLTTGGHSDWYLPALNEMNVLYTNLSAIGSSSILTSDYYWSSSEYSSNAYTYRMVISSGASSGYNKATQYLVRCVRR